MLICADAIGLVKRKHKYLEIQHSLKSKRSDITRSVDTRTQWQGETNMFKVDCDSSLKASRFALENSELKTPVKSHRLCEQISGTSLRSSSLSTRTRSFEATQRLIGTVAF